MQRCHESVERAGTHSKDLSARCRSKNDPGEHTSSYKARRTKYSSKNVRPTGLMRYAAAQQIRVLTSRLICFAGLLSFSFISLGPVTRVPFLPFPFPFLLFFCLVFSLLFGQFPALYLCSFILSLYGVFFSGRLSLDYLTHVIIQLWIMTTAGL